MRLVELDAKLTATQLGFRCPLCGEHRIVISIAPVQVPGKWAARGGLEDITVTPSIKTTTVLPYLEIPLPGERRRCTWHGFVTAGNVSTLGDSGVVADP